MSKIVNRTMDVFELFAAEARPLTLSEAAKMLDIPVSSCHDVLQTLEELGYLYQLGSRGGYYPTLRLQTMMGDIAASDPVLQRAEGALRTLRDRLDESVSLARVDSASATYLLVIEPSHALRFTVQVGERIRSLYATATGKAVLGSMPSASRRELIDSLDLVPLTEHTICDPDRLNEDIQRGAARGWYLNKEESVTGGITLAAPFRWSRSVFVVTVAGPASRIGPRVEEIAQMLVELCRHIENPGHDEP